MMDQAVMGSQLNHTTTTTLMPFTSCLRCRVCCNVCMPNRLHGGQIAKPSFLLVPHAPAPAQRPNNLTSLSYLLPTCALFTAVDDGAGAQANAAVLQLVRQQGAQAATAAQQVQAGLKVVLQGECTLWLWNSPGAGEGCRMCLWS